MRQRTKALRMIVSAAVATLVVPTMVGALGFEIDLRYQFIDFSGTVGTNAIPLPPDFELDLGQDLGLEADDTLEARFTFRPGLGIFVRGGYMPIDFGLNQGISIDLDPLPLPPIGANLSIGADVDYYRLEAGWQFVSPQKAVRIGPYIGGKWLTGDAVASFTNTILPEFNQSITESFEGGYPAVGALLEFRPIEKLEIFLDGSIEVAVDEADVQDFEGGVRYYVTSLVGLGAGYRSFKVDGTIDDFIIDATFDGFFLTVTLRF